MRTPHMEHCVSFHTLTVRLHIHRELAKFSISDRFAVLRSKMSCNANTLVENQASIFCIVFRIWENINLI